MCGIAGIINFNGQPVERADLKLMTDAINHRGPDGEGFFIHENVGFGHRRLAIIDLSESAAQPMSRFGYTITYNGEIYNYIELRQELEKKGIAFTTKSDTEVILAAYHVWGKNCVQHFNGMWALAIYDAECHEVFLSRDRFGEKPLYFTQLDSRFLFCSEIKGLKQASGFSSAVNAPMVVRYLLWEQAEHPITTFFDKVFKVRPAHYMVINLKKGTAEETQYYFPKCLPELAKSNEHDLIKELENLLQHAVTIRLRSDVTVGTCLSGGIDSSVLAAHMAVVSHSYQKEKPIAITAGVINAAYDERPFANMVTSHCGLNGQEVLPEKQDFAEAMQHVAFMQEEPFISASILMQYLVFNKAKMLGLKVMLDGQGADELFLGYKSHLLWALKGRSIGEIIQESFMALNHYDMRLTELISLPYHNNKGFKQLRQAKRWPKLQHDWKEEMNKETPEVDFGNDAGALFYLQHQELFSGTLPALLRYEDKNAMANGVETRLPYLDTNVVEFAMSLPASMKVKHGWSKYLLRKSATQLLPNAIVWRKGKVGFEAPVLPNLFHTKTETMHRLSQLIFKEELDASCVQTMRPDLKFRLHCTLQWTEQNGL